MSENLDQTDRIATTKQQAIILCRKGAFEQAREILEPLWQLTMLDADTCFLLGSIHGQLGKFGKAIQCFRKSVELEPGKTDARLGLAKALNRLGHFSEAEIHFESALVSHPGSVPDILELAMTFLKQNKFAEAEKRYQQVLELEPEWEQAIFGMGMLYRAWIKPDLAENYFKKLIDMNPTHADTHFQLGSLYYKRGQIDKAEIHLKAATQRNPSHVNAYNELGYLHLAMNRPDEAGAAFKKSFSLQPHNLNVIAGLSTLHDQAGDVQSAYELITPYIEQGIEHVSLGLVFANICRHFGRCLDAANYLERLLRNAQENRLVKQKLHFALGKLYDQLGDYDRAFTHYEQGNLYKTDAFNPIEDSARIDTLVKAFDWNFFVSAPRSSQISERPVFIVGMPRSGTTLTEQILASHPDIEGIGEVVVFPDIIRNLPTVLGPGSTYPENLKNLSTRTLDSLSETYLEEVSKLGGNALRVSDKTLVNFWHLGLISLMFPKARVIHCMRDPRDTCLSIFFQNFDESHYYANRLESLGIYYTHYRRIMQHWKGLLDIPILDLQYEDLIRNQEKKSRELIEFLGLEWDDQVLRFYESKRNVVTASYDQVRQKIYSKSTYRWKNYENHLAPLIDALDLPDIR